MLSTAPSAPWPASHESCQCTKGRPATGNMALGTCGSCAFMRVPRPPARIRHCMGAGLRSVADEHDRTVVLAGERDFYQALAGHGAAEVVVGFGIEEKESSSAGTHQFAPHRTVLQADLVPPVDVFVGHAMR